MKFLEFCENAIVSSQGIWKKLELFRAPHNSTIFDMDFHVDFM
ncbi:8052_t:CDS:2 [Rhizophagus irregularis]|nr:8052_t:CDS:2 [Rhizophagus irregularis]